MFGSFFCFALRYNGKKYINYQCMSNCLWQIFVKFCNPATGQMRTFCRNVFWFVVIIYNCAHLAHTVCNFNCEKSHCYSNLHLHNCNICDMITKIDKHGCFLPVFVKIYLMRCAFDSKSGSKAKAMVRKNAAAMGFAALGCSSHHLCTYFFLRANVRRHHRLPRV